MTASTVDAPRFGSSAFQPSSTVDEFTVDASSPRSTYSQSAHVTSTTVDAPAPRSTYSQKVSIVEETVDTPRRASHSKKSKMGYYDEDGKHCLPLS